MIDCFIVQAAFCRKLDKLDIVLSQNFFGSQPETGYTDGGLSLLLQVDGQGEFETIWPKKSGIAILEDAMVVTNNDGDADLLFVANSGKVTLLFRTTMRKMEIRRC